jgi:hypothetical protein
MAIELTCDKCGAALSLADELAGSTSQCPKCKAKLVVPSARNSGKTTVVADADDDLDSPARLLTKASDGGASTAAASVKKMPVKLPPPPSPEPFDPAEFLSSGGPEPRRDRVTTTVEPPADDMWSRHEERPKPAPAAAPSSSSGSRSDLSDHAKAAKQLRKAIKQSRVQLAELKDEEKNAGVDYSGMFREVGLKGGGALVLVLAIIFGVNWFINHLMGGGLPLPKLGQVSGTITYDGTPVEGVNVFFAPQESEFADSKKERARTSTGVSDANGKYHMQYIQGVDGVAVGKCRVWLSLPMPRPDVKITPEYTEASLVIKEVIEGRQTIDFPMKSK